MELSDEEKQELEEIALWANENLRSKEITLYVCKRDGKIIPCILEPNAQKELLTQERDDIDKEIVKLATYIDENAHYIKKARVFTWYRLGIAMSFPKSGAWNDFLSREHKQIWPKDRKRDFEYIVRTRWEKRTFFKKCGTWLPLSIDSTDAAAPKCLKFKYQDAERDIFPLASKKELLDFVYESINFSEVSWNYGKKESTSIIVPEITYKKIGTKDGIHRICVCRSFFDGEKLLLAFSHI